MVYLSNVGTIGILQLLKIIVYFLQVVALIGLLLCVSALPLFPLYLIVDLYFTFRHCLFFFALRTVYNTEHFYLKFFLRGVSKRVDLCFILRSFMPSIIFSSLISSKHSVIFCRFPLLVFCSRSNIFF